MFIYFIDSKVMHLEVLIAVIGNWTRNIIVHTGSLDIEELLSSYIILCNYKRQ